jgi:hypothetical protein
MRVADYASEDISTRFSVKSQSILINWSGKV